jgi:hypothetical protein
MNEQKRSFVTCEKVGDVCKVEAGGSFKELMVLTTELLTEVGLSLTKDKGLGLDERITPEDLIEVISSTAIENVCKRNNKVGKSQ